MEKQAITGVHWVVNDSYKERSECITVPGPRTLGTWVEMAGRLPIPTCKLLRVEREEGSQKVTLRARGHPRSQSKKLWWKTSLGRGNIICPGKIAGHGLWGET